MRIVALYRVSTEKQQNEGASLDAQQRRYRELAAAAGWETVAEFRGQESATGAASERLVLQGVLGCVRSGTVDALWVYEQSRLTRGDELEVALLKRELQERHIAVLVGTTTRDLTDISDCLAFEIQSVVDRGEAKRIKERFARGRRERALQGRKTGGKTPYGYLNPPAGDHRRGTLQPHPEEAAVVRRIFEASAGGTTAGRLAAELNRRGTPAPRGGTWGKTTLRRILENPVYLGTQVCSAWVKDQETTTFRRELKNQRAVVVEGAHEPLVSVEIFDAARAQRRGSSTGLPGVLTGFLFVDGHRVVIDRSNGSGYYRPGIGRGPWVAVEDLNHTVWEGFAGIVSQRRALVSLLERSRGTAVEHLVELELRDLVARRGRLEAKLERLVEMRADGDIPRATFVAKSNEVRRQLVEIAAEATAADRRSVALRAGYHERAVTALASVVHKNLSAAERRRVLRSIVERVDVELGAARSLRRDERGRIERGAGQKWSPASISLQLRRYPGPDRQSCGDVRSLVTVQIVEGGALVAPADALRRAAEAAA